MSEVSKQSLLSTAKNNLAYFWPAWVFPLFLYAIAHTGFLSQLTFAILVTPVFFVSFLRATTPWRRQTARYWHVAFWALLVPFAVWVIAIVGFGSINRALV